MVGGVLADIFLTSERGLPMSIYALGAFIGTGRAHENNMSFLLTLVFFRTWSTGCRFVASQSTV